MRLALSLDQSVGEGQQRRGRRHVDPGRGVADAGATPIGTPICAVDEGSAAVAHQQRRKMAGARHGDVVAVDVDPARTGSWRSGRSRSTLTSPRELAQDYGRQVVLRGVGMDREPKLRHRRRGAQAASGYIPDDQQQSAILRARSGRTSRRRPQLPRPRPRTGRWSPRPDLGSTSGRRACCRVCAMVRSCAYKRRFSSAIPFERTGQLLGLIAPGDQPAGQHGRADAEQHAEDPDHPRQALGERSLERMLRAHDEGEVVVPERNRRRRVLGSDRKLLQIRDQQVRAVLRGAQVQRIVEVGEGRTALELTSGGSPAARSRRTRRSDRSDREM